MVRITHSEEETTKTHQKGFSLSSLHLSSSLKRLLSTYLSHFNVWHSCKTDLVLSNKSHQPALPQGLNTASSLSTENYSKIEQVGSL